jgi:hypothetical protein
MKASNGLNLGDAELAGVDLDATRSASKGNIDDGALVRHDRGQSHHFLLAYLLAVTEATLARQTVMAVLNAGALYDHGVILAGLFVAAEAHRELYAVHSTAPPDVGCGQEEPGTRVAESQSLA